MSFHSSKEPPKRRRSLSLGALVFAGEVVYTLPYFLRRDYSNAMREAMGLSQSELGYMSSMFGVLALLCYGPGGYLADRYPPRRLIFVSLCTTSLIGLLLTLFPTYSWLLVVFALLGISSILPLWAALIKATRQWGLVERQGLTFGLLDGGRGLVAAVLASTSVVFFRAGDSARAGLRNVILYYCASCLLGAFVILRVLPREHDESRASATREEGETPKATSSQSATSTQNGKLRLTSITALSSVLFFAYASYWGTFYLSSFSVDAYGFTNEQGATLTSSLEWARPLIAVGAGYAADRWGPIRITALSFVVGATGYLSLAAIIPQEQGWHVFVWQAAIVSFAAFALRGVYYALLREGDIPLAATGVAVGVVSVVGYSPDVLAPAVAGNLLDLHPGVAGYRLWFVVLAALGVLGVISSLVLHRLHRVRGR